MQFYQTHANICRITGAYWFSKEALQAWILLFLVLLFNSAAVVTTLYLNNWQANFYTQLQDYHYQGFLNSLITFAMFGMGYVLISGYQTYCQMMLQIRWRRWLTTNYLIRWLSNNTAYHMQLLKTSMDNPDQRISEDINLYTTHSVQLFAGLFKHGITVIVFGIVLWRLSGTFRFALFETAYTVHGYLVWTALAYSISGTWLTLRMGRPLISLNAGQQRYEADFRYALVRLREYDEAIALYKGEQQEIRAAMRIFAKIFGNFSHIIQVTKRLTWLTSSYSQVSMIFAFLIAAPLYFRNEIQLGQLFEISGAYWYVHASLSYIVDSYAKIAEWRAVLIRLDQFLTSISHTHRLLNTHTAHALHRQQADSFFLEKVHIFTPDGDALITDLTLRLKPGDTLVISGRSGCGKTTLLRTLAGIWAYAAGTMHCPRHGHILIIPQKSYIPLDTIRNVLIYPGRSTKMYDPALCEALKLCKLEYLTEKLDHREDWEKTLSLGEQQRLVFARILLHKPQWVFLDEATSAIDEATEQHLYRTLQQQLPCTALISIAHRETLHKLHARKLTLLGQGSWTLTC